MKFVYNIWKIDGLKGFYRGLIAIYVGVIEIVIYFVIYEYIKFEVKKRNFKVRGINEKNIVDFL